MGFLRVSESLKLKVIEMKNTNSIRMIAENLDLKKSTVHYIIKKYQKHGIISNFKNKGRPLKIIGRRQERKILSFFKKNPNISIKEAKLALNLPCCCQTLRKFLKKSKFNYYIKPVKPYLYGTDKVERMEFATKYLGSDWLNSIFLDESSLEHLKQYQKRIWRQKGTLYKDSKYYFSKAATYIKRYTKFLAFISHEKKNMIAINNRWSANTLVNLLPSLFDGIDLTNKKIFLDHDTCHNSNRVISWFLNKEAEVIFTPKRSPDANCIENCFSLWKKAYYNIKPKPLTEELIKIKAPEIFNNLPQDIIQKLTTSMDRRCSEIIRRRGEITKY